MVKMRLDRDVPGREAPSAARSTPGRRGLPVLAGQVAKALRQLGPSLLNAAAVLLVVLLLLDEPSRPAGLVAAVLLTAVEWWLIRDGRMRPDHAQRAVLRGALVASTWPSTGGGWTMVLAVAALVAAALADPAVAVLSNQRVSAWRLPGFATPRRSDAVSPLFDAACGLTVLLGLTGLGLPALVFGVAAPVGVVVAAALALRGLQAARRQQRAGAIAAALADYAPRFAIAFSGRPEAGYQISMWLPYLERTGERSVLIVRERNFVPIALGLTTTPVLYVDRPEILEQLLVPGIGAVFYVNNEAKNAQSVRFRGPTHVHLGHGDSDKPPSYQPTTAMFDEIFVAGQAGIDRFGTHGVLVPAEKFRIVGRPQLERVEPAGNPVPQPPHVLYAPTWRGGVADMNFGSLRHGERIVSALLRCGAVVSFRPHPYSERDAESRVFIRRIDELLVAAGPQHLTSTHTGRLDIIDCLNAADALVTDVSSVASDFLQSGKPFAITDMGVVDGPLEESFPLAAAAYVLHPDGDLDGVLAQMLGDDPLVSERQQMRRYYLGGADGSDHAELFVRAVRAAIERGTPAATKQDATVADGPGATRPPEAG